MRQKAFTLLAGVILLLAVALELHIGLTGRWALRRPSRYVQPHGNGAALASSVANDLVA